MEPFYLDMNDLQQHTSTERQIGDYIRYPGHFEVAVTSTRTRYLHPEDRLSLEKMRVFNLLHNNVGSNVEKFLY